MEHPHLPHHQKSKNLFDVVHAKSAFWLGFLAAILVIGTIGFILLGSCVLKGSCSVDSLAQAKAKADVVADVGTGVFPEPAAAPANVPVITEDDHVKGNANALITIVEYSDFECPYCSSFHPTIQQVMDDYKGNIKWVYRHFPLSFHPQAEPAAIASECAAEQGKFWEYSDKLFENQSQLGESYYKQLASTLGLNISKFNDCLSSGKYTDKVNEQAAAGAAAGVTGTPGSFIIDQDGNAIPIKGALPYSSIAAAVEELLP